MDIATIISSLVSEFNYCILVGVVSFVFFQCFSRDLFMTRVCIFEFGYSTSNEFVIGNSLVHQLT